MPKGIFFSKDNHIKSFLARFQVLKMDSFTRIFQGFAKDLSNLAYDFWEDCFHQPRHLFVANSPIYLNISIGILKFPDLRRTIVFCKE